MRKTFRLLVATFCLAIVVLWLIPFLPYPSLSREALTLLSWDGFDAVVIRTNIVHWSLPLLWLSASTGLWYLVRPARTLFLVLSVVSVLLSGLYGTRVLPPLDDMLGTIAAILDGAILAVAYLTPLFRERAEQ